MKVACCLLLSMGCLYGAITLFLAAGGYVQLGRVQMAAGGCGCLSAAVTLFRAALGD